MKATLYKYALLLLLVPTISFAVADKDGKYKKTKTIKKEFNVNSNATLKIDNSYGNLDVVTWDENRIVFEIIITTTGDNEDKVQKKLNDIDVDFSASEEWVSAETKFEKNKSKSWFSWTSNNTVNMKINYLVKMPITNNVKLDNDYGSINLDRLEGRAELNCDYGKITTKELLADNNQIEFDYSNNCYFEYIKSGSINADYSGYTVAKAKDLDINADYTKSKIDIAENVKYNCDYGGLTVNNVNNLSGNGDYLTVVIGTVYKNINIDADYGSIKIEKLAKGAGNVNINSDYVGIKIGYDPEYYFNFDLDLSYGSLRDENDFEFTRKNTKSTSKYYQGYYGNSNSGNLVKIESDYGSVSFYKN
ncbi:hypothetical protein [Lacinutrix salivirga]